MISGGAVVCFLWPPSVLVRMSLQKQMKRDLLMDYYVNTVLVYLTMINGVISLLVFPSSGRSLLKLLDHFNQLDRILTFPYLKEEGHFSLRVLIHIGVILCGSFACFVGLYVVEVREEDKEFITVTDYTIPFILAVSGTVLLIPTGLIIFFLNGLRLRLFHFNNVIEGLVSPFTPSYETCSNYKDYGKELDNLAVEDESLPNFSRVREEELAIHLDKMRSLHAEMKAIACELGCIFGGHLVRDFLFSIMGLILYTYLLIYMNDNAVTNWFIYVVLDSFLLVKIVVMTSFAQRISCYVSISITYTASFHDRKC
jgi:hypothetical protein